MKHKCDITGTLILCSCHFTPMTFPVLEVVKFRIRNNLLTRLLKKRRRLVRCDVCWKIDVRWMKNALGDIHKITESIHHSLGENLSNPIPKIDDIIAGSVRDVILDYNLHPTSYKSICEKKLKLAMKVKQ